MPSNNANLVSLPCVATRDIIVHPHMAVKFDVIRPKSLNALKTALDGDRMVFLSAQKDSTIPNPGVKDIYNIGTVCEIRQVVNASDGMSRVRVEGVYKAKIVEFEDDESTLWVKVKPMKTFATEKASEEEIDAVSRVLRAAFEAYTHAVPRMPEDLKSSIMRAQTPMELYERIAFNVIMSTEDRQQVLENRLAFGKACGACRRNDQGSSYTVHRKRYPVQGQCRNRARSARLLPPRGAERYKARAWRG